MWLQFAAVGIVFFQTSHGAAQTRLAVLFHDGHKFAGFAEVDALEAKLHQEIAKISAIKFLKNAEAWQRLGGHGRENLLNANEASHFPALLPELQVSHLLVISARTATANTLNGELRLIITAAKPAGALSVDSTKAFGGGREDLNAIILSRALGMLRGKLPSKDNFWKKNLPYLVSSVCLGGTAVWMMAQGDPERKKLPDPENPHKP